MTLRPSYLASGDSGAYRRSRALHRFIVATPVLLLVAVGLVGRLRGRPYSSPVGKPDYDRRVLAYRDRVVAAEALPEGDDPPLDRYADEAGRWMAGFDSGSLTTLTPAVYEDHLRRENARGEVFSAGMAVASGLSLAADQSLDAGRPTQAVPAALLAARLANRLRGFELQACFQCLLLQRRAVGTLARAWPSLSNAGRAALRRPLATLWVDPKEVEGLAAMEEAQFHDYEGRQRLAVGESRWGAFRLGKPAIVAIHRSVRLDDAQIASLLEGDRAPRGRP